MLCFPIYFWIALLPLCGGGEIGRRREFGTLEHHNVVRVQIPFTAVSPRWIMPPPTSNPSPSPSQPTHDFSYLDDLSSCPPQDARPTDGTFYAFHDSNPPGPSDFQSAAQRNHYVGKDECQRRSNSIWSNLDALRKRIAPVRKRNPLIWQFISAGDVKTTSGVVAGDGPHHSFWVCATTSMHAIFNRLVK
jgi:hypothetical protein